MVDRRRTSGAPRFLDHATDLAKASENEDEVGVFMLDFKHAFMTVPLQKDERRFNASIVPQGICRQRAALHSKEPQEGNILVWNVLGFGGHANPLVYARVASFAARTLQALLIHVPGHSGFAQGRLQVYVDDPALVVKGIISQQHEAVNIAILWLMFLGAHCLGVRALFIQQDMTILG